MQVLLLTELVLPRQPPRRDRLESMPTSNATGNTQPLHLAPMHQVEPIMLSYQIVPDVQNPTSPGLYLTGVLVENAFAYEEPAPVPPWPDPRIAKVAAKPSPLAGPGNTVSLQVQVEEEITELVKI